MIAAQHGHGQVVNILMNSGASVKLEHANGQTAAQSFDSWRRKWE